MALSHEAANASCAIHSRHHGFERIQTTQQGAPNELKHHETTHFWAATQNCGHYPQYQARGTAIGHTCVVAAWPSVVLNLGARERECASYFAAPLYRRCRTCNTKQLQL